MRLKNTTEERFWPKVDKTSSDIFYEGTRCWVWIAGTSTKGGPKRSVLYGAFRFDDRMCSAHVVSYILKNGPIRNVLKVCHHCDIPLCVNPKHLFLGTQKENMRDCVNKGRLSDMSGENNPFSILTKANVIAIRNDPRRNIEIAPDYNIDNSTVGKIKRKVVWKHIT